MFTFCITVPDPSVTAAPDNSLAAYLPHFAAQTVLVLGDVMLDRYVLGEVSRISPEAPIPVLRAGRRMRVLGGAGNVAQNVASLGARAVLVGVVGDDPGRRRGGGDPARLARHHREPRARAGSPHHGEDPLHDGVAPAAAARRGNDRAARRVGVEPT